MRRRCVSGSSAVASACAHSIAICLEPISVEWMLQVTRRMALPSRARARICSSDSPAGSASLLAISRIMVFVPIFTSLGVRAVMISSPSVVLPRVWVAPDGKPHGSARSTRRSGYGRRACSRPDPRNLQNFAEGARVHPPSCNRNGFLRCRRGRRRRWPGANVLARGRDW